VRETEVAKRLQRLKTVKSALILEAQSLKDRGLGPFARPFYQSAADAEMAIVELLESLGRQDDARINLLSAASCLVQAGQFEKAVPILEMVQQAFPEARDMLRECRGKKDEPLIADTPDLRALIQLLLRKGLISEDEWAEALQTASPR